MIYFIQNTKDLSIKIGYTKNVKQRLSALQTASAHKLTVLGTMRGDRVLETYLQERFHIFSLSGEWFRGDKLLLDYINEHCSDTIPKHLDLDVVFPIDLYASLRAIEIKYIAEALTITKGHQANAAKLLGIGKSGLSQKIKKHNIPLKSYS